ncbi:hypothetical protein MYCTH_90096 [Thermothelomyces thermophilus ATCC 42464]|uniref:Uncharacterized protein n=1 Tax=Thermothelomyces thermophilus (strain ATCC 42464 / BCRC 31852 / DSM 1799) TaxID=573729 RepID=G2QLN6_THET4|nr:uncharacterized protein MYCTH_90096 [Thermothelomyces thermophilus ATCC 42464]AEO60866.1 hypothetical protein MYCTH_90096 [Thermothelomyces thermophilus ATCC 42464]
MSSSTQPRWRRDAAAGAPVWRPGMIAFLHKKKECYPEAIEDLISTGHLPHGALGHPVIILQRPSMQSTHVLITTVSSYCAEENNGSPPWKQPRHRSKCPEDFRSFLGSERVSNTYQPLRLHPGKQFPKPSASWVYIQSAFVVPVCVLGRFFRPPMPRGMMLTMLPESLEDLRCHMAAKCKAWAECQERLLAAEAARLSLPAPLAAYTVPVPAAAAANPSSPSTSDEEGEPAATVPAARRPDPPLATSTPGPRIRSFAATLRGSGAALAPTSASALAVPWRRQGTSKHRDKPWKTRKNWRE